MRRKPYARRVWLITLESFLAVQAVYGGVALALDTWHLDRTEVTRLPFVDSWVLPGAALALGIAVPMAGAAWLELAARPAAPAATATAGTLLVGWVGLQLVLLPSMQLWLQPLCAAAGLLLAVNGAHRMGLQQSRGGRLTRKHP